MNEIKLLQTDEVISDLDFAIGVMEEDFIGKVGYTEVELLDSIPGNFDDDDIYIEFENVDKADKLDYGVAAACGILTGSLSILWAKKFDLSEAHEWGSKKADEMVKAFAKSQGYNGSDLSGAIAFLEKKFPMAGDCLTNAFGGGKQHHLRDFSHHPTIIGLLCSIIMQFTGIGFGTDTQGNLIHVKMTRDGLVGNSFPEKIICGTINWIGHLISDMSGSKGSVLDDIGRGTGVPGPLLATLKELSSLKIFSHVDKDNNNVKTLSLYISKLFNGTLIKTESGEPIKFDLRTEMGIGHYISNQAKPIIINEALVRCFYMIRRFINEVKEKDIKSLSDISKLDAKALLPINSRPLTRMLTVSSGVFVTVNVSGTAIKALTKSKGSKGVFLTEFFLSINYVGIGRFVFACAADSEYIKEDIKTEYEKYIKEKEYIKNNAFRLGYEFMSLDEDQLRILYSLKALAVEYDIEHTKDPKVKLIKEEWIKRWKAATINSIRWAGDDYFYSSKDVYSNIYTIDSEMKSKGWLYLIALELQLFQAYYSLEEKDKELFRGLKYSDKYLTTVFCKEQKFLNSKDLNRIKSTYNNYRARLKESGKKAAIGIAATVATTTLTGGFALAFAPELAVVLAGGSFVGLYGAALTNASLAAIGGGALAAGGFGMAGGTAILTGGGALLGIAGAGSTSLFKVFSEVSEDFTLNECCKLLTFCKLVVIEKYKRFEVLNPIIAGIERCINQTSAELDVVDMNTKLGKKSEKRIKSSIRYLNNTVREMDQMMTSQEKKQPSEVKPTIGEGTQILIE